MSHPKGNKKMTIADFIRGSFVGQEWVLRNLPFAFYLTVLGLVAIRCSHQADEKIAEIQRKSTELNELESHYLETKSALMQWGMESHVQEKAMERGLVPSRKPPVKIEVKEDE